MNFTYSLDLVKEYLEQNKFNELNQVLNYIISVKEHTKEDYQILMFLEGNSNIAEDSKEKVSNIRKLIEEELIKRGVPLKEEIKLEEVPEFKEKPKNDEVPLKIGMEGVTLEERTKLEEYANYLQNKFYEYGLTMKEITFNGDEPHITFLNNFQANNIINNLMIQLDDNRKQRPYVEFELSKLWTTGEETFTLSLLTGSENQNNEIFEMIEDTLKIVESTNDDINYEEELPLKLTEMKKEFSNHTPDLTKEEGKFNIKCIQRNGEDRFYLVADTHKDAKPYAEELNLSVKDEGYDTGRAVEIENIAGANDNLKEAAKVKAEAGNVNVNEKASVKTLGTMPTNINFGNDRNARNARNAAYSNIKNIMLIIALVILVIIVVSIMTLRG